VLAVVVDKLVKYGAVMFTIYLILDKAKIRIIVHKARTFGAHYYFAFVFYA
jgi:hypothetical protein